MRSSDRQVVPRIRKKIGRNLLEKEIQFMEQQRLDEYGENNKDFRGAEKDSHFYFLQYRRSIKAFGMLKPVDLDFQGQSYPILGIGNVIAIVKRQGYGTQLVGAMTKDLLEKGRASVGITHKDNYNFYQKLGFEIYPEMLKRFIIVDKLGNRYLDARADKYAIITFNEQPDHKQLITSEDEIKINVPMW